MREISYAEDSAGSALVIVIIDGNAFNPESVIVKVGGEVMWRNMDVAPHTVTADDGSFNSGTLGRGDEYRRKFSSSGTIKYSCDIHSYMTGTVEVGK
jgi:plastocyanin